MKAKDVKVHLGLENPREVMCYFFNTVFILNFYLFIFGCSGSLILTQVFSSCCEWGLLSSSAARSSHFSDFSSCRAWAVGTQAQ